MPLPLDISPHFAGADLVFSATGLPDGLSLDPATGVISGVPTTLQTTSVTVTATNPAGQASDSFNWTITLPVQQGSGPDAAPESVVVPSISGTALIGQTLTADPGDWDGLPAPALAFQWRRAGAAIPGATVSSYTLTGVDDQAPITVSVTATNPSGSATALSAPVTPVHAAPVAAGALPDRTALVGSGPLTVDAAADFTGATGGSWSVTGAGASIDTAGRVTIPTDIPLAGAVVSVDYANSGGSATSAFQATVATALPGGLTLTASVQQDGLSFPPAGPGGAAFATIPLSGTATPGSVIEVRDYRTKAPAGFVTIATADGAGNWSGTVEAVPQPGGYFRPEVRLAANPAVMAQMPVRVGVGPVILLEGQSIEAHIFSPAHDSLTPAVTPTAERVLVMTEGGTTALVGPGTPLTSATASLANTLIALGDPDYTYTLIAATVSGTSKTELIDDSDPGRSWANLQARLDVVYGSGSHVSLYQEKHFNADAGKAEKFVPFWTGLQADGAPVSALGAGISNTGLEVAPGAGAYDLDHCLFDLSVPADQFGRGVLRRDQTRLAFHFQVDPADKDMLGQMVNGTGGTEFAMRNYQRLWQSLRAEISTGVLAPLDAEALYTSLFQYGSGGPFESDASHPADDTPTGLVQHAARLAAYALDRLGEISLPDPATIASVAWAVDGSSAIVTMSADVTTNEVAPAAVASFEIARNGQDQSDESIDWRFADTTGTVTVGPAPNQITLTPATAFANGDAIRFGYGGASGQSVYPAQSQAEFWKRYPVTPTPLLATGVPALPQGSGLHVAAGIGAVPVAFAPAGWSVADNTGAGAIDVTVTALPASATVITGLEARIDGGAWTALGGATTGTYTVSGLTDGVAVAVEIRALNAIGAGAPGDVKTVTPQAPATGPAEIVLADDQAMSEVALIDDVLPGGLAEMSFEIRLGVDGTNGRGVVAKLLGISGNKMTLEVIRSGGSTGAVRLSARTSGSQGWINTTSGAGLVPVDGSVVTVSGSLRTGAAPGQNFARVWIDGALAIDETADPASAGFETAGRRFYALATANGTSDNAGGPFEHLRLWLGASDPAGDFSAFGTPHAAFAADPAAAPAYGLGDPATAPVNGGTGGPWITTGGPAVQN